MDTKHKIILTAWSCALLLLCLSLEATACTMPGWFGSQCQYRCRCTSNNCDIRGQCTGRAKCEKGWFGPACQYVDLASRGKSNYEITDGDETTCVTARLQSVTLTLNDSYHFTWLRVHVRQPDSLHDLTVTFNSSLSCTNPRSSSVDDTALDIYCDLNQRVKTVTLTGTAVQDLCSVYVSGGRNVALKQTTSQSSTYWERTRSTRNMNISFTSDKAVDGDTSGDFYTRYPCSCTRETNTSSEWSVRFSKPQRVSRYVLYNRDGHFVDRIIGFILESSGENGDRVFIYTDKTSSDQFIYRIRSENVTSPVSRVMIKKNVPTYLAICELEIYGDSVCDSGYYGRECEHKCNCVRNEACFVSTGGCPSGCADGFQGFNCNEICDAGKYGANCNFNCSQFCQLPSNGSQESSCDHVDGTCRHGCQAGYEGMYCLPEQAVIMAGTVAAICVAVAVVLIITIILAVVVCRRRLRTQSPYDRPDNTQQDNYPYTQPGSSEAGYEGVSRIKTHLHNVNTREVKPDSNKMQQELGALSCDETDIRVYEDVHADKDNSGRNKCGTYSNI